MFFYIKCVVTLFEQYTILHIANNAFGSYRFFIFFIKWIQKRLSENGTSYLYRKNGFVEISKNWARNLNIDMK